MGLDAGRRRRFPWGCWIAARVRRAHPCTRLAAQAPRPLCHCGPRPSTDATAHALRRYTSPRPQGRTFFVTFSLARVKECGPQFQGKGAPSMYEEVFVAVVLERLF